MANKKNEDLIFVSFDRIWSNFKKFWWISVLLLVAMLYYGASVYYSTLNKTDLTETDKMVVNIEKNEKKRVHAGISTYQYKINAKDYVVSLGINPETVTVDEDYYKEVLNYFYSYTNQLINSSILFDSINAVYKEKGYDELKTVAKFTGDDTYDMFSVSLDGSGLLTLSVSGIGGYDRIEIAAELAEKYFDDNISRCEYAEVSKISATEMFFRYNVFGINMYSDPSDEAVYALYDVWEPHNSIAIGATRTFDFQASALTKTSTIIKGIVGFVVGLLIIFIIAVFDKKVRNMEELCRFESDERTVLGEIFTKKPVSVDITSTCLAELSKKLSYDEVLVVTPGSKNYKSVEKSLEEFVASCNSNGIKASSAQGIEADASAIKNASNAQAVVMFITSGLDDVATIRASINRIDTVKGNLIGYVFCK